MPSIDLNADLGEGAGTDEDLLHIVTSASVACGGHAGDTDSMRQVLQLCSENGVRVGAHPGYADRERFGRFRLVLPVDQLLSQVRSQLIHIRWIAAELDVKLEYMKLHGALANQASEDLSLSIGLFATALGMDPRMATLALDNSMQVRAAKALGMPLIREAYADRAYSDQGLLIPRNAEGAVIEDREEVVERCLRLAKAGEIVSHSGKVLASGARSICLHGDTPGAVELARAVREALEQEGVDVRSQAPEVELFTDLNNLEAD
ncbi:UPF0271 protein [Devosia pacifica]|uniref:UPF0271 protein n=1 Tax=Devosia pacifica TaxID=1335967 RepID=A0A918VNY9_9HYPH|nr:5-oxoprolinase subunit PxpA [Devosia pacifica]GHA11547.1 UPF0271 protein [Devosia pacifica]